MLDSALNIFTAYFNKAYKVKKSHSILPLMHHAHHKCLPCLLPTVLCVQWLPEKTLMYKMVFLLLVDPATWKRMRKGQTDVNTHLALGIDCFIIITTLELQSLNRPYE